MEERLRPSQDVLCPDCYRQQRECGFSAGIMNGKDSEETWQLLKIFIKTHTHTQHARLLGSDTLNITLDYTKVSAHFSPDKGLENEKWLRCWAFVKDFAKI